MSIFYREIQTIFLISPAKKIGPVKLVHDNRQMTGKMCGTHITTALETRFSGVIGEDSCLSSIGKKNSFQEVHVQNSQRNACGAS